MDTNNIPKAFWYALSLCMLAATFGLLFIAYRSTTVSIEIANTKIELSSALSETKEIKSELEQENQRLKAASAELRKKVTELERLLAEAGTGALSAAELRRSGLLTAEPVPAPPAVEVPEERFQMLDKRIEQVQRTIEKR